MVVSTPLRYYSTRRKNNPNLFKKDFEKGFNIFDLPPDNIFFKIIEDNYYHEDKSHPNYWFSKYNWKLQGRDKQIIPWNQKPIILCLAGRGFGKTRMGAEWVRSKVETHAARGEKIILAIIGQTAADNRDTLINGESGLIEISPPWFKPWYVVSEKTMYWPNGSKAIFYSGDQPEQLRGPNPMYAWVDEGAKFQRFESMFSNLELALRAKSEAFPNLLNQVLITTTPKPLKWVRKLMASSRCLVIKGSTHENKDNLSQSFFDTIEENYEGTSIGRQEIYADILEESEKALFTRESLITHMVRNLPAPLEAIATAIDPPGKHITECGIISGGVDSVSIAGQVHFYITKDYSVSGKPNVWGRASLDAYYNSNSDYLVAETNFGGHMIEETLFNLKEDYELAPNYQEVIASKSKQARAEPIATLAEKGRLHLVGEEDEWESLISELVTWEPSDRKNSPNRMDAMVWLVSFLNERYGANSLTSTVGVA